MKTIVISNRKGGSAKTTTAVNIASGLAKHGSVLLLDLDTQGHASIGVGCEPDERLGVHSIFSGSTLSETFIPTVHENLTLSPALAQFDVYEYSDLRGILKNRFKREKIADFFDYCVIDTPPTFDALLKNSLEVADSVMIPFVPHHLGVVAVGQMLRAVYQTSKKLDREIADISILPVMFNPHINEHKESLLKVKTSFGGEKLLSPIGVDIKLAKQFESGSPIILDAKRSKGMKDYKKCVEELLQRL
ncbi:ParA family protein [Sulfurimonas sp.]|uniref:ParA family protein n=1 Tax=Sulfurimonas sp. TaxID=2022749 RepID=UPI0025F33880|nr:ParA family protein [Sulfurimonas sp.]MBT5935482.1 ParA family protein [Sulfurimonas sp.]